MYDTVNAAGRADEMWSIEVLTGPRRIRGSEAGAGKLSIGQVPTLRGERGVVATRLVFGYFEKSFMMNGSEAAAMRQRIIDCATHHGLAVDAIYVDEIETAPAQLAELVAEILSAEESVMIIPSLLHLARLGNPIDARADFENNGVRVLVSRR